MSAINKILQPFTFGPSTTQTIRVTKLGNQERVRKGKTSKDKANGHVAYKKNRRVWDRLDGVWVKQ